MSKKDESTILDVPANENPEKQDAKKEALKENVIYLGPDIPNVVAGSTVFEGGVLPEAVNEKIEALPILSSLFVTVSGMVEKVKELNKAGSSANTIYARVKAEIKKED